MVRSGRPTAKCPYRVLATTAAWEVAYDDRPVYESRFVPESGDRRSVVLLIDVDPRPTRAEIWQRLIATLASCGVELAARGSAPNFGTEIGAAEVLAFFVPDSRYEEPIAHEWWSLRFEEAEGV